MVRYGDDGNNCGAVKLQFEAGRGTNMRLSQVGVAPGQLNANFFTHMHSDHTDGFDRLATRFAIRCKKFVKHIADAFLSSGEISLRRSEDNQRLEGGPADLTNVNTLEAKSEPQVVWSSGDVKVSAIRSTHIDGHASYRVDTSDRRRRRHGARTRTRIKFSGILVCLAYPVRVQRAEISSS